MLNFMCRLSEDAIEAEVHFSLYDNELNQFFSERIITRVNKHGMAVDGGSFPSALFMVRSDGFTSYWTIYFLTNRSWARRMVLTTLQFCYNLWGVFAVTFLIFVCLLGFMYEWSQPRLLPCRASVQDRQLAGWKEASQSKCSTQATTGLWRWGRGLR